jgi:phosphoglycolate phosphatase
MPSYAAIFDLDGTLVNSLGDIGGAMNHALAAHGLPTHPLEAYRRFVGEGVRRLTERTVPAEHPELVEPVLAEYQRFYAENLLASTRPFDGIAPLLDALLARGVRLAVLSNKPDPATQTIVRALFARSPFRAIQGERPNVPRKPDPTGALQLARVLAVEPAHCLFVGDSGIDMQTAVNAGMLPVGVLWGLRDRDELLRHGARWLLAEPVELIARLDIG